jgi:tetratricopeptide (TPR) repeat protein
VSKNILIDRLIYLTLSFVIINTFTAPGYTEVELKKIEQTNKPNQILPQNQLALELAELNRSIDRNPRDAVAYNNRAILKYEKLKDISGALADYNKSILILRGSANELNPNNAIVYTNRAIFGQYNSRTASLTLDDYDKAIELNPKDATSYELRAVFKHSYQTLIKTVDNIIRVTWMKDLSGALADYNKAIELNPNDASTYNNRGHLKHFYLKDRSGALADYNKAIELDSKNATAHKYRDLLKNNVIKYEGSIMDLREASRIFFLENNDRHKIYGRRIN